jgi:hypothetical protein
VAFESAKKANALFGLKDEEDSLVLCLSLLSVLPHLFFSFGSLEFCGQSVGSNRSERRHVMNVGLQNRC